VLVVSPKSPINTQPSDEVGYGKTVITLGLIDSAPNVNGAVEPPSNCCHGLLYTKATLVIVPGHLMSQWPKEIYKFLSVSKSDKRLCVITSLAELDKTTVDCILKADIVVCPDVW